MWCVLLSKILYHMGERLGMEKQENSARSVLLVFIDRHTEQHTPESAERVCSDCRRAGFVIDALTSDERLQTFLRDRMDRTGDLTDIYGRG